MITSLRYLLHSHNTYTFPYLHISKIEVGWYHAEQMLRGDIPSAALSFIVEPWFLGAGT